MATVFMKWLERKPDAYDRGIQMLTLGWASRLKREIVARYARPGLRILEIGCGTGELAVRLARRGARVTGIDASLEMLDVARLRVAANDLEEQVDLHLMDATQIVERFEPGSFDLILATLVFSELPSDTLDYVLEACPRLLKTQGRLVVVDEVLPAKPAIRRLYRLLRLPWALVTWLLTRTTTRMLVDFPSHCLKAGLQCHLVETRLLGSLAWYECLAGGEKPSTSLALGDEEAALPTHVRGRLRHQVSVRNIFMDLWSLFFRIIPPYPNVEPGLYAVGEPNADSPVLVTGNYDLTVRRVVKAIDGYVDVWLLVADSAGINVWCGAGGGYFTAEKIIAAMNASHLAEVVNHRALILPQLCANGVDGWRIRDETGWGVHWGPVRARDIPAYLAAKRKKTDAMRWVTFPLMARLEMVTVTLGFYGLLILLPVAIFWRHMFVPITGALLGLSYFYAVVHPWLPGRDGLAKSIPLALIALLGFALWVVGGHAMPAQSIFNWTLGLIGLSVFTAAELQGMSPLMRGEQANWTAEAVIGAVLALVYWLGPIVLGWR